MRRALWLLIGLVVSLAGCARSRDVYTTVNDRMTAGSDGAAMPEAAPAEAPAAEAMKASDEARGGQAPEAIRDRKIIYTADLAIEVKQLEPALGKLKDLVRQAGGYISGLQQSGGATGRTATVTVRVPAARFDQLVEELSKLGTVVGKSISTEDVSEQYVDLDARLRNLKREEERFLLILTKASRMQDVLAVERELARVRGEIEQIEGQLRHLNHRVSLSTVTVNLSLPADIGATVESGSWIAGVGRDAAAMFVGIGKALLELLIYLAVLLPYLALLCGVIWLVRRLRRR